MNSGTVDSIVYDTVLEETGSSAAYEKWIGRVRMVESAAFAGSAVLGGLLAGWTSPRVTYFVSVPIVLASIVAFLGFDEPRLNRAATPVPLRRHIATTFGAMTRIAQVRRMMLLGAVAALLSQAVFEFGPLWLVALRAPTAVFGPYWAALVGTLGLGGYLISKLHLERARSLLVLAVVLVASPVLLATSGLIVAVVLAQTALQLLLTIVGIHAGLLLHDSVPSEIRAGVSSGVGTLSWVLFLPFSLVVGALANSHGVRWAGWVLVGAVAVLALLLAASTRTRRAAGVTDDAPERNAAGVTDDAAPEPKAAGVTDDAAPERKAADVTDDAEPELPTERTDPPSELVCRQLVTLVTDYLDGVLPPNWKAGVEDHLQGCDGCTRYLQQLRATIDALERLRTDNHREA
jgi:hypothetical protein